MSQTRMLLIDQQKGTCREFIEYQNSHGAAPVVWNIFSEKYWGKGKHVWLLNDELEDFWNLYCNISIPLAQRAVFVMTFDKVIVSRKNYRRAIDDIEKFIHDFTDYPDFWTGVNHWSKIIHDIAKVEFNTDAPAIGFHMTTVSRNPFLVYNEEDESYTLDPEIFELYDELEKIEIQQVYNGTN